MTDSRNEPWIGTLILHTALWEEQKRTKVKMGTECCPMSRNPGSGHHCPRPATPKALQGGAVSSIGPLFLDSYKWEYPHPDAVSHAVEHTLEIMSHSP